MSILNAAGVFWRLRAFRDGVEAATSATHFASVNVTVASMAHSYHRAKW
jgi:hypothetical protein